MITGICPGSFDPVTLGHLDIINRAAKIFDNVCVVVMVNLNKRCFFTVDERIDFIRRSVAGIPNVSVVHSDKLLAEFSKSMGDCVLVKGLRAISDFEIEFQMALINRKLNPKLETVFLPTSEEYLYLSSSLVKEVGSLGGDISGFVPREILGDLDSRLKGGKYHGKRD